jgi:hypothetical protein
MKQAYLRTIAGVAAALLIGSAGTWSDAAQAAADSPDGPPLTLTSAYRIKPRSEGARLDLVARNLGPRLPEVAARLLRQDGPEAREVEVRFQGRIRLRGPRAERLSLLVKLPHLPAGLYNAEVTVTDPDTGRTAKSVSPLTVSERRVVAPQTVFSTEDPLVALMTSNPHALLHGRY